MSASEAPVLLGRICSSWRAISLSTPRLWASLHVVEPGTTTVSFLQKVAQRLEVTKTWLARSGNCPLSLSLHSVPELGNQEDTSPISKEFLQTLISFAPRWQNIHFATPPSLLLEIVSYLNIDTPWLETVAFHHQSYRALHSCGPFNMFRGARISSFSIPASIFIPERFPLLWNELTTLTIGGPAWVALPALTSHTMLRVLSGCPQLRCCKLMISDGAPVESPILLPTMQRPIVELPFLHTLAVHSVAFVAPTVSILLMRLSLPKMRNFTFLGSSQDCPALNDFFADLIRLENVDIDTTLFSKTFFLNTLCALPPTVQRLRIRDYGLPPPRLDDDALVVLASPGICPALQHLSIDSGMNISDAAVVQFITARMRESQPMLKHIKIHFNRQMNLDVVSSIQRFIDAGLLVSLIYNPAFSSQCSPWEGLPDAPLSSWNPPWLPAPNIAGDW
ncbi:hypothetical protein K438DRAFT_1846263 [Mycena galopus ATCC 62051]|nr:hypothetical protein K438DRAFT_1846263 [Mycena galopus ATCC 62051]